MLCFNKIWFHNYSLNQEICEVNLLLKIKNQKMVKKYFMKLIVMIAQKYMPGKLNTN